MTSDEWVGIAALAGAVLILIMNIIGAVLLTGFLATGLAHSKRVLLAVIGGSAVLLLPFLTMLWLDDRVGANEELFIFLGVCVVTCLAIGWPIAHFATKRLDRMTKFDLETFK